MGPTFHFDTPKLNFNTVSYGRKSRMNLNMCIILL